MNFKHYTLLLLSVFLIPLSSFAEPMVINCDNYLNDNNLAVTVSPVKNIIKAGESLDFNGIITNKNNFPIADFGILLKIVKKQSDEDIKTNGLNIIDQFYPLQMNYLTESKNGMDSVKNFSTIWKVPENLPSGEYGVISYLASNYKVNDDNFNLNPKQISYFTVTNSKNNAELILDRSTVLLNGKKYVPNLIFKDDEPVKISFNVKNPTNEKIDGTVYFKTYNGEINDSSNIIKSGLEYFSLDSNSSKEFSYTDYGSLKTNSKTVVEIYYGDRKYILNIDYKREGFDDASVATFGLNKFPVQNGYTVPLYVCYKTGNSKNYENADLNIEVIDSNDNLVYSDSTKIDIDNLLRGYVFPVKFNKNYSDLMIRTSLLKGKEILGSQELVYSCNQSQDGKCGVIGNVYNTSGQNETTSERIIIISITLLLFVGTAIYLLKHKKNTSPADNDKKS